MTQDSEYLCTNISKYTESSATQFIYKKFELMLMRHTKAYSSSGSVV